MARSLISGRSGTVGLIIIDSMAHRFAVPITLGAEAALGEIELSMMITDARGDVSRLHEQATMLRRRKVDGVIVVGDNQARTPSISAELDAPVVYVYGETGHDPRHRPRSRRPGGCGGGRPAPGRHRSTADRAPDRAGRVAGGHATGEGSAQSAWQPTGSSSRRRSSEACGRSAGAGWPRSSCWSRSPGVDAILCGSDQIASGVVDAVRATGRRIPEDVAVTGYDNWPVFALETSPALTTVDMNLEELGRGTRSGTCSPSSTGSGSGEASVCTSARWSREGRPSSTVDRRHR